MRFMVRLVTPVSWDYRTLVLVGLLAMVVFSGCSTSPPENPANLCSVFDHEPRWYDFARQSHDRWGTPIPIKMAIINQESGFRSEARPPRSYLFGVVPWTRPTTAYGYAQAQDPVWKQYMEEEASWFTRRNDMEDALDFVGWYNHRTHLQLGISKHNAEHLYYAYHEGRTGYRDGRHHNKPGVRQAARRVNRLAVRYQKQLERCEDRFRCRRFWQIGPLCDS